MGPIASAFSWARDAIQSQWLRVRVLPTTNTGLSSIDQFYFGTAGLLSPSIDSLPSASPITFGDSLSSSTLSGGAASVPGDFAFADPTVIGGAGTSPQTVSFTPSDLFNYSIVDFQIPVSVLPAIPVISALPSASSITEGEPVGNSILLGGVTSVPGTFAFVDPAVIVGLDSPSQPVRFTPADSSNYTVVDFSLQIPIQQTADIPLFPPGLLICLSTGFAAFGIHRLRRTTFS